LRIFASVVIRDIRSVVFLSCSVFGFGIRAMLASSNELDRKCSLPFNFWKSLIRVGVNSSLFFKKDLFVYLREGAERES